MPKVYQIGHIFMPLLPFLFVFSLLFAQKSLREKKRSFLYYGLASAVSLLLIIYGLLYLIHYY